MIREKNLEIKEILKRGFFHLFSLSFPLDDQSAPIFSAICAFLALFGPQGS